MGEVGGVDIAIDREGCNLVSQSQSQSRSQLELGCGCGCGGTDDRQRISRARKVCS